MADAGPGSLDRLHDIALPPPVPWWPPAPALYALAALALVLSAVLAWQLIAWRARTRYRRAALAELDGIDPRMPGGLSRVAELVRRVALVAFPRDRVVPLTGEAWLAFLDSTGGTDAFTRGPGRALGDDQYRLNGLFEPPSVPLVAVVRRWISHHRTDRPC